MNTPAHIVLSALVLGRRENTRRNHVAIFIGALLPDAPLFFFYFVEKWLKGIPEEVIWTERYYLEVWQNFFDIFNSLPIMAVLFVIGLKLKARSLMLVALSMVLHVAGDLPLHHDDGHRHLFPLSDWRFQSPFSYWDPAHYGTIIGWLEVAMVLGGCVWLLRRYTSWLGRGLVLCLLASHVSYLGYAFIAWVG